MSKRYCFYVDETMNPDGKGFIPALVTEGEPGYTPMGDYRSDGIRKPLPWRWGDTIEVARATVIRENDSLGISESDAHEIVLSSMVAGRA
jgi:hypothetical protein